jgi:hypothetical protein
MRVEQSRLDIVTEAMAPTIDIGGPVLDVIDLLAMLRAIADVESSYGQDSKSRHEPAYCHGGKYYHVVLTKLYGCAAHCSYGPWQVMYPTAYELGFFGAPEELANPETNCLYAVRYLNARAAKATTIEEIARAFNGGSIHSRAVPQSYIDKLTAAYRKRAIA